jgi:hypothetical protein
MIGEQIMYKQTEIDLINRCLEAIGETPLEDDTLLSFIQRGTDVDVARTMVNRTLTEVLKKGWYFNTDYNLKLVPDNGGFITLPDNVLRVDFGNTEFKHEYTIRNNKVYDMVLHTFLIGKTIEADMVYYVPIEELPISAYEYIGARAARKFQEKVIGDLEMNNITMKDELDTHTELMREQLQYQDYGMIRGSRIHNAYLYPMLYKSRGRR